MHDGDKPIDPEKILSLGIGRGQVRRTERRDGAGGRIRETTTRQGTTVTHDHADGRRDVTIRPGVIRIATGIGLTR